MFKHTATSRKIWRAFAVASAIAISLAPASAAFAGECPTDKTKPNARQMVDYKPVGVTDVTLGSIDLGKQPAHIDRRMGILASLLLLAIPTSLLAIAPNLAVFTTLRIMQGICMASAFTLTLAYLGEQCSAMDAGGAFAAYITGNVASNLIGRLISATVADSLGLARNFYFLPCSISLARCWSTSRSSASSPCIRPARRNRRFRR